ncbi:MAG: cytochrome c biogenesis protein CcsA [Acidobacteria bacterium]|nr:cytochrome c biogenesis protein CcsA [Acidobacteriota bacterium]
MGESSVFWLRVTLLLYSLGLWHSLVTVVRRRQRLFRLALGSISLGAVFHLVSIVDQTMAQGHVPVHNLHEMASLVAFLITGTFLLVYWRYKYESLAVFVFPTVFLLTMVASLGTAAEPPEGYTLGRWWLISHVLLLLLGYAALTLTFVAGVMYIIQEKELKSKRPRAFYYRLPPLGALDEMAYRTLAVGFVLVTLGLISGSFWAFVEWGSNWIVDPTIALAFVTWAIYLAMVFSRLAIGWRGRKAAYFSIAGFCSAALTWIVNSGVHTSMRP